MLKNNRRRTHTKYSSGSSFSSLVTGDEKMRFGFFTWVCWCCIGFIVLIILYFSALQLYGMLTTSNFFCIERINIYGASFFHRSEILKHTKLQTGINSFTVNIGNIEKILSCNPWVEKVSVKRRLPGIFDIFIKEYEPSFWVFKDDVIYYADSSGRIITPLNAENFKSLPTLEVMDGGEHLLPILKPLMQVLRSSNSIIDIGTVSALRVSSVNGIEIILENHDIVLNIDAKSWRNNLEKAYLVLSDVIHRGELKRTKVITSIGESVWVTQEKAF